MSEGDVHWTMHRQGPVEGTMRLSPASFLLSRLKQPSIAAKLLRSRFEDPSALSPEDPRAWVHKPKDPSHGGLWDTLCGCFHSHQEPRVAGPVEVRASV